MILAFYKGTRSGIVNGTIDRTIKWWTNGPYSHVELGYYQVSKTAWRCWSSSNTDGGVRSKVINLDSEKWDIIEIPDDDAMLAWFQAHEGLPYDLLGLFGFVWVPYNGKSGAWFCSEAIAASMGFENPRMFHVNLLYSVVKKIYSKG